jgi:sirohydrochlorin cobaltochelatase
MQNPVEQALEAVPFCFGQVLVRKTGDDLVLCHRDDQARGDLAISGNADDAIEIAKYDDDGNYRPLKTAPNLRHGW